MEDNELRQAEERVRLCKREGPDAAYNHCPGESYFDDCDTLATAWLAEHPDDGSEPTTEAWLRVVGMIDPEPYSEPDKNYYGDQAVAVVAPGVDGLGSRWGFMCSEGHDGWWACMTNCDGFNGIQDYLCPVPTRDHVRQFCKVFNIKLKETA